MNQGPHSLPHEPAGDGQPTPSPWADAAVPTGEERQALEALRAGDEAAFVTLVERVHPALLRPALLYVHDRAVAEEVVQDTWIGVLKGLDHFEPRASLKTWIFQILINRAKTCARREGRTIPFSAAWDSKAEVDEPSLHPSRALHGL
jgi:RNA polymerase sigma-70 factor, ECF subfamily